MQESMFGNAAQEQAQTVDSLRDGLRKELVGHLGFSVKDVFILEQQIWDIVDSLLPELLHCFSFQTAEAAIRCAQQIILRYLEQSEGHYSDEDIKRHLTDVMSEFSKKEGEEDQDKTKASEEQEKDEPKSRGERNKRYMDAMAKAKRRKEAEGSVKAEYEKATWKAQDLDELLKALDQLIPEALPYKEDFQKKLRELDNLKAAFYLIELIKKRDDFEERIQFVQKLSETFTNLGFSSEDDRRSLFLLLKDGETLGEITAEEERNVICGIPLRESQDIPYEFFEIFGSIEESERRQVKEEPDAAETIEAPDPMSDFETAWAKRWEEREEKAREKQKEELRKKSEKIGHLEEKTKKQDIVDAILGPLSEHPRIEARIFLYEIFEAVMEGEIGNLLLENCEEFFAFMGWPPGNERRKQAVDTLQKSNLLPEVDMELLLYGEKSVASVMEEAEKGGWITKEEAETCGKLLGRAAFGGIVYSHMQRRKPGPLRAMVKQILFQRENVNLAPPMTNGSLVLDTNAIDVLMKDGSMCSLRERQIQETLDHIILTDHITDIRITNMNVAELSAYGGLIGRKITRRIKDKNDGKEKQVELVIYGVPYRNSRATKNYESVFTGLLNSGVGEGKGDADRSMMADIFLAQREEGAIIHFATGDVGITSRVVGYSELQEEHSEDKSQKRHPGLKRFDPNEFELPAMWIHCLTQPEEEAPKIPEQPEMTGGKKQEERKVENSTAELSLKQKILSFQVGGVCTVQDILRWVTDDGYEIYIVGGAVRDVLRNQEPNDIDMKTNMPLWVLGDRLKGKGVPVRITPEINLIKAGEGKNMVDIVSTTRNALEPKRKIDRTADMMERDFVMNAAVFDYQNGNLSEGEGAAEDHARRGLLKYPFDMGDSSTPRAFEERAKIIVERLKSNPELLGRTLKFIERGYREWSQTKEKTGNIYHLEPEVLDIIRINSGYILEDLLKPERGPSATALFIHKAGFQTPAELIAVMNRLQFPPDVVRMIYPDSVAGMIRDEKAYSRDIFPRNRPVGQVEQWDPSAAPMLKVDVRTGNIYQYRVYAYIGEINWSDEKPAEDENKVLIDLDCSDHGIQGHSSPHYHVFRVIENTWKKNESGFSNTGQPGKPPVVYTNGRWKYVGPQPWKWWDRTGKIDSDKELERTLRDACKLADIQVITVKTKTQIMVTLENQITVPLERIRELVQSGRITKLLMFLQNLKNSVPVVPQDDTLTVLTGSGEKRERLRFQFQLREAREFLLKVCNADLEFAQQMNIDDNAAIRLYDLAHAGYGPEEALAAGAFACRMCRERRDPYLFASYFEYHIATARNKVPVTQQESLFQQTEAAFRSVMDSAKATAAENGSITGKLTFANPVTAAYHLHKHQDMLKISEKEMLRDPDRIKDAVKEYMGICEEAVTKGEIIKAVHETEGKRTLYFRYESHLAVVETDLASKEAVLLTCYSTYSEEEIHMDTRFLSEADSVPMQHPRKDGHPQRETVTMTPLGPCVRVPVLGDGDCFFTAVEIANNIDKKILRNMAVDELRSNREKYQDLVTDSLKGTVEEAINYLSQEGNWSRNYGDLVPMLMSDALKTTIYILASSNGRILYTIGEYEDKSIAVFYNGTDHYDAVVFTVAGS